jgi:malonate transporter
LANAVLNVVLPLFGIMLAGYLAGRTRLMSDTNSEVLNRFVFNVSFPALVFISLAKVNVEEFFNWPFLGALGGGMLATFAISFLVARVFFPGSLTALGLHGLTAMFSSTAYIGLPLILVAFGNDALVPGIIGAVITGVLFLPIAIVLAEIDKGRSSGNLVLAPALSVMRNPVLIATVAGLAASALGIAIPKPVNVFCDLLGGAFVPCALFSAGLFMVGCTVKGEAAEITWWLAYHVFELDGILPAVAVLQAALPTGVPVFILAQQYGVFVARSNATIVISTALSVATLSALLIVLG